MFGNMTGWASFNHKGELHWFFRTGDAGLGRLKRVRKSRDNDTIVSDSGKVQRVRTIPECLRCKSSSSQGLDVCVRLIQSV